MTTPSTPGQRLHELSPGTPPANRKKAAPANAAADVEKRMARIYAKARQIRAGKKLGLLGTARMAKQVQRGLLQAGQPPALLKKLVFSILANALVGK